jgi:hypothetical protein
MGMTKRYLIHWLLSLPNAFMHDRKCKRDLNTARYGLLYAFIYCSNIQ